MSVEELEERKGRLIARYMKLQDAIDEYNGEVYQVCCEIQALNMLIDAEKKKRQNGVNGSRSPQKGAREEAAARPRHPEASDPAKNP